MKHPTVPDDHPPVVGAPGERNAMAARPRTGLLARLFGLVLLSIIPALAVQTYNEIELRKSREADVRQEALRLAKFATGELDRIIDNGRALLVSLANLRSIRDHDGAMCTSYVKALNKAFPQYRVIGAIDLAGKPFCASAPIPDGATMADRAHFKEAIATGELAVGAYSTGRLIDEPIVPLLLSFRGPDDRVAGAVYVSLNPQWLAEYFRTTKPLDGRATLAIVDHTGTIIARLPNNMLYAGSKLGPFYDKYVFAERSGADEIIGVDGVTRILGYVPINEAPRGLYVGVGLTKVDMFAAVNRASLVGFSWIVAGLLLGILVAWLGVRRLLFPPIRKLVEAAAQWGNGNFQARAAIGPGFLELSDLGRTFDTMAAALQQQQEHNAALLASLEDRVEQRTQALEASNHELSAEMRRREEAEEALRHAQKIEALGQLTGGIAHDFNDMLHVILGNLDIVDRQLVADRSNLRNPVQTAIRAAERAAASTRQLLAFGRRQPLTPRPVDINSLIAGMEDLLRRTLGEAVDVKVVAAAGLWPAMLDSNELESALINLAVNARDAMPSGGRLTIETGNVDLDAAYAATEEDVRPGQYVLIAVSDTGCGMSREVASKAFDPFFTTKDVGQGSGLGLSQVYGFTKQSGGHAKIYSELGGGTTVKLYLPRLMASTDAPHGIHHSPPTQAAMGKSCWW